MRSHRSVNIDWLNDDDPIGSAIAYNAPIRAASDAASCGMSDLTPSQSDPDVARLAALPVSVVADVLDRLGRRSQAMEHTVRPIEQGPVSVTGRAFTIAATASDAVVENPYELELAAVDATPAGAVVVLATGGCLDVAIWGELLATRMLARGGVGVVTDGGVRDVAGIRRLAVPTFAAAITPATRSAAPSSRATASR